MADQFDWWRAALAGEATELPERGVVSGYYRYRNRDGEFVPVGIWRNGDGAPLTVIDGKFQIVEDKQEEWSERIFAYAARNPVTFEAYTKVQEGGDWPDTSPDKRLPSNMPDDPAEAMKIDLEAEEEIVNRLLGMKKWDDVTAAQASSLVSRITTTGKRAGSLLDAEALPHKEAARPHLEAADAVKAKWTPLGVKAKTLVQSLKSRIGDFLLARENAEKARIAEKNRKIREAREKAEAAQREADRPRQAEWEAAGKKDEPLPPPVQQPPPMPTEVEEEYKPTRTNISGAEGRAVGLKTERVGVVTDIDALFQATKTREDVIEFFDKLAKSAARAKVTYPGMTIENRRKAV